MGGAFVAIANDGSALFYNPAGIAFQPGTRMEMDGFLVKGFFHFTPSSMPRGQVVPSDGFNGAVSPPFQLLNNMYMTKSKEGSSLSYGLGLYAPFGLGDNWTNFKDSDPNNTKFVGRFAGTRGRLENIWLQPTVAFRMFPNTSLALGPALVYTHIMLEQSILNPTGDAKVFGRQLAPLMLPDQDPELASRSLARLLPEGRSRFAGIAFAPGVTLGLLHKFPARKLNIGVMWRSPVTFHVSGKASFAFTSDYALKSFLGADTIPKLFPTQDIKAGFSTPGTLSVGVAKTTFWNSLVAFDFLFQNYRRFKDIPLNFSKTVGTATPPEVRFNFNFRDTFFLRAGIEKRLNEKTIVRAGYYYDRSAVPDQTVGPFFPDSSKNVVTAGFSRQKGNREFTFFYQGAKQIPRVTNVADNAGVYTNGTYRVFIHLFGFGFRLNRSATTIDVAAH